MSDSLIETKICWELREDEEREEQQEEEEGEEEDDVGSRERLLKDLEALGFLSIRLWRLEFLLDQLSSLSLPSLSVMRDSIDIVSSLLTSLV